MAKVANTHWTRTDSDGGYNATITARGNGLCGEGELIADPDTSVIYRIKSTSRIHTSGPGCGDYVYAAVEATDLSYSDVPEDELSDCAITLGDDASGEAQS